MKLKLCLLILLAGLASFLSMEILGGIAFARSSPKLGQFDSVVSQALQMAKVEIPPQYRDEPLLVWEIEDRRGVGRDVRQMEEVTRSLRGGFQSAGHPILDEEFDSEMISFIHGNRNLTRGECKRGTLERLHDSFMCRMLLYGYVIDSPIFDGRWTLVLKMLNTATADLVWRWEGGSGLKWSAPAYKSREKSSTYTFITDLKTNLLQKKEKKSYEIFIYMRDHAALVLDRISDLRIIDQQLLINEELYRGEKIGISLPQKFISDKIQGVKVNLMALKGDQLSQGLIIMLAKSMRDNGRIHLNEGEPIQGKYDNNIECVFTKMMAYKIIEIFKEKGIHAPVVALDRFDLNKADLMYDNIGILHDLLQFQMFEQNNRLQIVDYHFLKKRTNGAGFIGEDGMRKDLVRFYDIKYLISLKNIEADLPRISKENRSTGGIGWVMRPRVKSSLEILDISKERTRVLTFRMETDELNLAIENEKKIQRSISSYGDMLTAEIRSVCENYIENYRWKVLYRYCSKIEKEKIAFFRAFDRERYKEILNLLKHFRNQAERKEAQGLKFNN